MIVNKIEKGLTTLLATILFISCDSSHDAELMKPDGQGNTRLTPLGCLVNGPWHVYTHGTADGYNVKLFINDKEISSIGAVYNEIQKDLVFELHKDGKITYWLGSENNWNLNNPRENKIHTIIKQSPNDDDLKQVYSAGYWKANFKEKTLFIHFENKKIPEINYKWNDLGNGVADFQQVYFFDSIYNGKKVVIKKVNTIHYETLYPRF